MSAVGNDIGLDAPVAGRTDGGIVCHFAVVTAIIGLSHTVGIDDMVAVCRGSNAYHRRGTARTADTVCRFAATYRRVYLTGIKPVWRYCRIHCGILANGLG